MAAFQKAVGVTRRSVMPVMLCALTLGGLILCAHGPAFAATKPSDSEAMRVRKLSTGLGDCLGKDNANLARAIVLSNLPRSSIRRTTVRLANIAGSCLIKLNPTYNSSMTFPGDYFYYTLAGSLVRKDYPVQRHNDFSSVPPLFHAGPAPLPPALKDDTSRKAKKAVESHTRAQALSMLSSFGECVTRLDPDKVQALLLTGVGSDPETTAFRELATPFSDCLTAGKLAVPRDLAVPREMLRGTLALNFYRLAGAPPGAAVATLKVDD